MKPLFQRILAIIGLVLICASIVLMLTDFLAGAAAELLHNISLMCFLGAAALLMFLSFKRKQAAEQAAQDDKDEE